jgi:molecular chaperone DnaK (HSP70)
VVLPKSIGIKLFDDTFVPVLTEGEIKSKKLILTTVKDNQEKAIIELYEGNSDKCINNEYLGKLVIAIHRNTVKGEPGIEAHLRLSDEGMLYAKAWDSESGAQSEIKIEHSASKRIFPETLSDEEIKGLNDTAEKVESISDEIYEDKSQPKGFNAVRIILAALIILVFLALLILLGIFLFNSYQKYSTENKEKLRIEQQKKLEYKNTLDAANKEAERLAALQKEQESKNTSVQSTVQTTDQSIDLKGKKHYIRWGDNLWNICKRYYKDPWYYPSLADVNNIKVPRKIYAGTYITIPDKSSLTRWDFKK